MTLNNLISAARKWQNARYAYLRALKPTQEQQIDLLTAETRLNDAVLALDTIVQLWNGGTSTNFPLYGPKSQ